MTTLHAVQHANVVDGQQPLSFKNMYMSYTAPPLPGMITEGQPKQTTQQCIRLICSCLQLAKALRKACRPMRLGQVRGVTLL
jgi:hypothetical protein